MDPHGLTLPRADLAAGVLRDPLQAEPSPYETLGVAIDATDREILAAFGEAIKDGKNTHREMRAKRVLQDPVERALVDAFEYRPADLMGLVPSPLEDPSALEPAHRAATARAWEEQLARRFPDLAIAHSLAVLWHWWTEHDASEAEDGASADGPSVPEMWERSIAYWGMLVNAEAFWQAPCRGDQEVARRARQRLVEGLRNRLDRARSEHETRHDDGVAGALLRLEVMLDTEIETGRRIAESGVSTPHGKVTCGPVLLRHLGLLESVTHEVDRALLAKPGNTDLQTLRDALSPLSHVAALIQQAQPQRALDALDALPAEERDAPAARAMRSGALRLLGEQAASVGDFEGALAAWRKALDDAQSADDGAAIRSQVASACLRRVAAMPDAQRDAAISLLDKALALADDEQIRARLAELLVRRGIDTINRAQEKANDWTERSVKIALRKGVADLDRAVALGSPRAAEQARQGHELLERAESGTLGVPPPLAGALAEANGAAERKDWNAAVAALTRAVALAGPTPPDALRNNLAVCLANRATETSNQAVEMLSQKSRTIDEGLRKLRPAWRRAARKLERPAVIVGIVLRTILALATWVAIGLWALNWAVTLWWPDQIGSWYLPNSLYDWLNTAPNIELMFGVIVLCWIGDTVIEKRYAGRAHGSSSSACSVCGSVAGYEVRSSDGRVPLCQKHAHRLEAWMKVRPFIPAAVGLLEIGPRGHAAGVEGRPWGKRVLRTRPADRRGARAGARRAQEEGVMGETQAQPQRRETTSPAPTEPGRAGGPETARLDRCPVCPFRGLRSSDLACPSCGTDLSALRRVQELPLALLRDALDLVQQGRTRDALGPAEAAAALASARPVALLVLGDVQARLGDLEAASRRWREAAELGLALEAGARLDHLAEVRAVAAAERSARRVPCPNEGCPAHGLAGRGRVVLVRVYGRAHVPLWRCRSCSRTFSGNRGHLLFRARVLPTTAYAAMAGLLGGRSLADAAVEASCSISTVRRLGARAISLGPQVVDEVAAGLHVRPGALRRGWTAFARRSGRPA